MSVGRAVRKKRCRGERKQGQGGTCQDGGSVKKAQNSHQCLTTSKTLALRKKVSCRGRLCFSSVSKTYTWPGSRRDPEGPDTAPHQPAEPTDTWQCTWAAVAPHAVQIFQLNKNVVAVSLASSKCHSKCLLWSINCAEKGILGNKWYSSASCLYSVESFGSVGWLLALFHRWYL